MPAALTLYLFLFFSSKIPLPYLFSYCFFFLIIVFYFFVFKFLIPQCLSLFPVHGKAPFIMSVMIGFYYFAPQQPLSSLGVLADHHWSVFVPLPIARQRKTILFVCLPWHPFLLWSKCLLSPYPSWHTPNGFNSALLLLSSMSSQQDTSPKRARVGTSKQVFPLSPPPNHVLLCLTHNLTVSCIGQVQAGEVWALRMPFFHVCPKSTCCSCVFRGWPAQSTIRFLTIFWFPFPLWFALLQDWALLDGGLCFFLAYPFSCYHFLPYHFIIPATKLFASILLGFFGPTVYSSPNDLVRPLVFLLHH